MAVTTILALNCSAAGQCQYEVTIIETPDCPGSAHPPAFAQAISEEGHVAGYYCGCACLSKEAFVWTPEGGLVTLPRPPGSQAARAYDLNHNGWVVGSVTTGTARLPHAVYWVDAEGPFFIEEPDHATNSEAFGVNDDNVIVGRWGNNVDGPANVAFQWEDGHRTDLGLPYGPNSAARAITFDRTIVGWMGGAPHTEAHAFRKSRGTTLDLGTIPGGISAVAMWTSRGGSVAGWGLRRDGEGGHDTRGFFWRDDVYQIIDPPTGCADCLNSGAAASNDVDQVVGWGWNPGFPTAFLWQAGRTTTLNDVISDDNFHIEFAHDINGRGAIAGTAVTVDAVPAVVLAPLEVPDSDFDIDCRVGVSDLVILLDNWGSSGTTDLNGDGVVDVDDLVLLLLAWTG